MTQRENLLALLRRQPYEFVPVEFMLCPSLVEEYRRQENQPELPYEDESFSFLLAAREAGAPPAARVLRRPRVHSGFVELSLCRAGGAAWEKATRKSPDFKRARKAEPGDGWGEGT